VRTKLLLLYQAETLDRRPEQYGRHGTCRGKVSNYATGYTQTCCPLHIRSYTLLCCVTTSNVLVALKKLGKTVPITGREGPWGCEMSRLPHFLDNRLTDGGEVVSLTRQLPFTPRKIPGTHLC
jgi:hypothetical protein